MLKGSSSIQCSSSFYIVSFPVICCHHIRNACFMSSLNFRTGSNLLPLCPLVPGVHFINVVIPRHVPVNDKLATDRCVIIMKLLYKRVDFFLSVTAPRLKLLHQMLHGDQFLLVLGWYLRQPPVRRKKFLNTAAFMVSFTGSEVPFCISSALLIYMSSPFIAHSMFGRTSFDKSRERLGKIYRALSGRNRAANDLLLSSRIARRNTEIIILINI